MAIERFCATSWDVFDRRAAILTPDENGRLMIEAVGGDEVLSQAHREKLKIGDGVSGLATILYDSMQHGVINPPQPFPRQLIPELSMSYGDAMDRPDITTYFVNIQIARDIAEGVPRGQGKECNPLLFILAKTQDPK